MLSWTTFTDSCRIQKLAAGINIWARSSWYIQWDNLTCISINVNWLTAVTWGHRCLSQIDLQKYTLKRICVCVYMEIHGCILVKCCEVLTSRSCPRKNEYIYIYTWHENFHLMLRILDGKSKYMTAGSHGRASGRLKSLSTLNYSTACWGQQHRNDRSSESIPICYDKSPMNGSLPSWSPSQRASYGYSVPMSWRSHEVYQSNRRCLF